MEWYAYLIILFVLLIIAAVAVKLTKKDFSSDVNKLIKYLGGKENIINAEVNVSRFKVILKDVSIVDKEAIQKLGAQGIVEIDNQLKIIFGKDAKKLKEYIKGIVK